MIVVMMIEIGDDDGDDDYKSDDDDKYDGDDRHSDNDGDNDRTQTREINAAMTTMRILE